MTVPYSWWLSYKQFTCLANKEKGAKRNYLIIVVMRIQLIFVECKSKGTYEKLEMSINSIKI